MFGNQICYNRIMKNLREIIGEAEQKKVAVGHFNFTELTVLKAILEAARELKVSVILGNSESEKAFLGDEIVESLIGGLKVKEGAFFNADHTKSLAEVKKAVEMGYDAILFDGSHLPFEENIRQTKEVVEYVKSIKPMKPNHPITLVEGEIGYIGSGSVLREAIPENIQLTTPEEAVRFVKETGVDLLAPAVGNIHGMVARTNADDTQTYAEPRLDIQRIADIKNALRQELGRSMPLVLHGASGNSDEDIQAAIKAGVNIVHISTEIRLAWRRALADFLQKNPEEIAPYKILAEAQKAAAEVVKRKLILFNSL